jgi:hypothetical protein
VPVRLPLHRIKPRISVKRNEEIISFVWITVGMAAAFREHKAHASESAGKLVCFVHVAILFKGQNDGPVEMYVGEHCLVRRGRCLICSVLICVARGNAFQGFSIRVIL